MDDDAIDAPEEDYLFVGPSQLPEAGRGLYTAIPIHKGEIIAVYAGELLGAEEAARRAAAGEDRYFINLPDGRLLDSMHTDCLAKYANDAAGPGGSPFANNARIALNSKGRPCLVATRTIKSGAELFCGYGKAYWRRHGPDPAG